MNYIELQKMRKAAAITPQQYQADIAKEQALRARTGVSDQVFDQATLTRRQQAQQRRAEDAASYANTAANMKASTQDIMRSRMAAQERMARKAQGAAPKSEPRPVPARTQPAHMGRTTTGTGTMKDAQGNVWSIQNGKQTLVSKAQQPRLAPKPQKPTNAYNISRNADIRAAAAKVGIQPGQITRVGYDANGRVNRINGIGI